MSARCEMCERWAAVLPAARDYLAAYYAVYADPEAEYDEDLTARRHALDGALAALRAAAGEP